MHFIDSFLFQNMIRRDDEFDVFILQLLVFRKRDTGRQVDISIEICDVDMTVTQISDIGFAWQRYFVFAVGYFPLDLAWSTCEAIFLVYERVDLSFSLLVNQILLIF